VVVPAQGQRCQHNKGNNASATTVTMPAQCLKGRQRSVGKDTSSAMRMCCDQHCQWVKTSVTRAMTPSQQSQQHQHVKSEDSSAMLAVMPAQREATMPAQRRQRCQRNAGKDASAVLAKKPALQQQRVTSGITIGQKQAKLGQQCQRMEGKDTSAMLAVTPAQQGQVCQRNKGNNKLNFGQ
jgi:hypothetical protein